MVSRRQFLLVSGAVAAGVSGCSQVTSEVGSDGDTATTAIDPDPVETPVVETPTGTPTPRADELSADGYPKLTLNRLYYAEDVIPTEVGEDLTVTTTQYAPQRALDLNVVSICYSQTKPKAYFEEYQTAYGAEQRLAVDVGDTIDLPSADTTASVTAIETISRYPNNWYLIETEFDLYSLSRVGGIIAGGQVSKDTYMDPVETVLEQIRSRTQPEAEGLPSFVFDVFDSVAGQYGHQRLDLAGNDAASVPMAEFSPERARSLVEEQYDYELQAGLEASEVEVDGFPVDAHEGYEIALTTDEGDFTIQVVSWVSVEHATRYAKRVIKGCDWTFDAHFPSTDIEESDLGPFDSDLAAPGVEPPLCGFGSEAGVQKLLVETHMPDFDTLLTSNVFSGNVTMVHL